MTTVVSSFGAASPGADSVPFGDASGISPGADAEGADVEAGLPSSPYAAILFAAGSPVS